MSACLFTHGGGERPIQYQRPGKHDTLNQCCFDVGPALQTMAKPQANIGLMCRV